MGGVFIAAGILGMITGLLKLVTLKNVALSERKKGLVIFASSLVLLLLGFMIHK